MIPRAAWAQALVVLVAVPAGAAVLETAPKASVAGVVPVPSAAVAVVPIAAPTTPSSLAAADGAPDLDSRPSPVELAPAAALDSLSMSGAPMAVLPARRFGAESGLAVFPVNKNDQEPDASGELFDNSLPAGARVDAALAAMPKAWKTALRKAYRDNFIGVMRRNPAWSSILTSTPRRIYGLRWERGEDSARAAVALGFRPGRDGQGRVVLREPGSIGAILSRYDRWLDRVMTERRLGDDEVIRLALPFERKGSENELVFVRPGIDQWPSESEWSPVFDFRQLSFDVWYRALAEGKLPFFASPHEFAHASEFPSRPSIMATTRRYAQTRLEGRDPPVGVPGTASVLTYRAVRRAILSEFFSLPNLSNSALIRDLIAPWFRPGGPRTLEEAEAALKALAPAQREAHVADLVNRSEETLVRLGGGSRDFYNESMLNPIRTIVSKIQCALRKKRYGDYRSILARLNAESLHTLVREIELLSAMRFHPDDLLAQKTLLSNRDGYDRGADDARRIDELILKKRTPSEIDDLLCERTARLEMALYKAVELELTPETVYSESFHDGALTADAKTRRYFESFVEPGSVYHGAFLAH